MNIQTGCPPLVLRKPALCKLAAMDAPEVIALDIEEADVPNPEHEDADLVIMDKATYSRAYDAAVNLRVLLAEHGGVANYPGHVYGCVNRKPQPMEPEVEAVYNEKLGVMPFTFPAYELETKCGFPRGQLKNPNRLITRLVKTTMCNICNKLKAVGLDRSASSALPQPCA